MMIQKSFGLKSLLIGVAIAANGTRANKKETGLVEVGDSVCDVRIESIFEAKFIGITAGDARKVLDGSNTQRKIRFQAIDAPETKAKQALSNLIAAKMVRVVVVRKDRYK